VTSFIKVFVSAKGKNKDEDIIWFGKNADTHQFFLLPFNSYPDSVSNDSPFHRDEDIIWFGKKKNVEILTNSLPSNFPLGSIHNEPSF
jgi:hypothetical protein